MTVYLGIILRRGHNLARQLICSKLIEVNIGNILAFPKCVWKNKIRGTLKERLKKFI